MARQLSSQRGGYLEALLIGSPLAILATNADGVITFANNEACKMTEREMRELVGESIVIVYENLDAARETNRQIYIHGGSLRDHETHCKTKSGKLVKVRVSAAHLKDSGGNFAGAVGFFETYRPWTDAEAKSRILISQLQAKLDEYKNITVPFFELLPGLVMVMLGPQVEPGNLERITNSILQKMKANKSKVVLIDLNNISAADGILAGQLCKMIRTINLSGSKCIMAGIQPDFAQVMEPLIGDISYLKFFGSVDQALEASLEVLGFHLCRKDKTPGG